MSALRVLHFSDPHFSVEHHYPVDAKRNRPRIGDTARAILDGAADHPDLMILSGDVTWEASARQFAFAIDFIDHLRAAAPAAELVIVPGNHDVDMRCKSDTRRQNGFIEFLRKVHTDRFEEFYPLLATPTRSLTLRERILTVRVSDSFVVCGVNSAAYLRADKEPDTQRRTPVYLGPRLLEAASNLLCDAGLEPGRSDQRPRLFVMHHHLLPFAEGVWEKIADPAAEVRRIDDSIVGNSGKLQRWLHEWGFDVVLHGHKHIPHGRVDTLYAPPDFRPHDIIAVGAGSSGVTIGHRNEGLSINYLTVSKFTGNQVRLDVSVREFDRNRPQFNFSDQHDYVIRSPRADGPLCIVADTTDDAYAQIEREASGGGTVYGFMCRVLHASYRHPPEAALANADVANYFHELNPQLSPTCDTPNCTNWNFAHHDSPQPGQRRHGDRLFEPDPNASVSVWDRMLEAFYDIGRRRRAYASLYNTVSDGQAVPPTPPPGLVGVQLIRGRDDSVDIVGVFRHLELSTWFLVNCYELCVYLNLATRVQGKPGTVTLMATHAAWEPQQPRVTAPADLDKRVADLPSLVSKAAGRSKAAPASRDMLGQLLLQKHRVLHGGNIDVRGIVALAQALKAFESRSDAWGEVARWVSQAATHLRAAAARTDPDGNCYQARELIKSAADALTSIDEASR